jgi:hypothetical protein
VAAFATWFNEHFEFKNVSVIYTSMRILSLEDTPGIN